MSFLTRSAVRTVLSLTKPCAQSVGSSLQTQCLLQASRSFAMFSSPAVTTQNKHMRLFSSSRINGIHTKGDRELVEFLQNEITMEKKNLNPAPAKLGDFTITKDDAALVLKKNFHDEEITITLNVNHTVSEDAPAEKEEDVEMTSQPDFEVDIKVGSKTLSLTCQFTPQTDITEGDQIEDVFGISELTMFEGDWEEKTFCVAGGILDAVMYDLLMNSLEERGISNEFVQNLSQVCTDHEHALFVKMLDGVHNFFKRT